MSIADAVGIALAIASLVIACTVILPITVGAARRRLRWLLRPPTTAADTAPPPMSPFDRRIADLEHEEQERVIEQRIRNRIADELHAQRHRRGEHQPDSWFWAMTHAERTIRGEH